MLEKSRRHELASSIEQLRRLVPQPLGPKATKADVLATTITYIKDITMQYNLLLDQHRSMQGNVTLLQRRVLELEQLAQIPQAGQSRPPQVARPPYGWPGAPAHFGTGPQLFTVLFLVFFAVLPLEQTSFFVPTPSRTLLSVQGATSTAINFGARALVALLLLSLASVVSRVMPSDSKFSGLSGASQNDPELQKTVLKKVSKLRNTRTTDPVKASKYATDALILMGRLPEPVVSGWDDLKIRIEGAKLLFADMASLSGRKTILIDNQDLVSAELHCYLILMEQKTREGNRDLSYHLAALKLLAPLAGPILLEPHSSFSTLAAAVYQFISFGLSSISGSILYRQLSLYAQRKADRIRNIAAATKTIVDRAPAPSVDPTSIASDELSAALSGQATDFIGRSMKLLAEQGQISAARGEIEKFVAILDAEKNNPSARAAVAFWRPKLTSSLAAYDMLMEDWPTCFNRTLSLLLWYRATPSSHDAESELMAATIALTSMLQLKRSAEVEAFLNAVTTQYADAFVAQPYSLVSIRRIEAWWHSLNGRFAKTIYLLEEAIVSLEKHLATPHLGMEPIWFTTISSRVFSRLVARWAADPRSCVASDVILLTKALQLADKSLGLAVGLGSCFLKPAVHCLKAKLGAHAMRLLEFVKNEPQTATLLKDVRPLVESFATATSANLTLCKETAESLGSDYDKFISRCGKMQTRLETSV